LLADLGAQGAYESNWGNGGSTRTYNLAANAIWDLPGNFTPCLNTLNLQLDGTDKVRGDYTLTGHPLNEFCHLLWVDVSGHFQLTTRSTTHSTALPASLRNRGGSIHASAWGWVILAQRIGSLFGTLGDAWNQVSTVSATMVASQLKLRESDVTLQTLMQPPLSATATAASSKPTKTPAQPTPQFLKPLDPGCSEWGGGKTNEPI
jgi:hypothetical protein